MILDNIINLPVFISFLIGIFLGITVAVLIYLILVFSSMSNKKHIIKTKVKDVSADDVVNLIHDANIAFNDKTLRGESSNIEYAIDISKNLIITIAKSFYPKSKHPLLEISIDEALMLGKYISDRLDEVLDHKGLRFLKKFKISYIVGLYDFKENIMENNIVKATRKYKISNAFNSAKKVINIVNPIYWARKFVVSKAIDIVLHKLCVVMISVAGEETYKIYSKSIYNKDNYVDSGIDDLVDDLNQTVKADLSNEEIKQLDTACDEDIKEAEPKIEKKKKKFLFFKRKD
jgi:hypothetical protein